MTLSGTVMISVSCFAISAGALAQQVPATPTPAPSTEQPAIPSAQPPAAGSQAPASSGQITRDQFVQRAAQAAGRTFDRIDTNHSGVITQTQLRQWQIAHQRPARPTPSAVSQ